MADTNFITTYMPSYAELSATDVADTRQRLTTFIKAGFPDVELNPNTVAGDLIVTPMAYTVTAIETGLDRFMSDLNTANIADDIIYNCDFVEAYLQNFNVDQTSSLRASGVVRLAFSENKKEYLDRSVRFSFNDSVFSIYFNTDASHFVIYPVGGKKEEGVDGAVLTDSGSDAYYVDIPVVGVSGSAEVEAATPGLINSIAYDTLGAITALTDFNTGTVTSTLPQMASDTRRTVYAASLNTRNGAIQYVSTSCPFVESVYAIISGDNEMLRAYAGEAQATSNCLDLYARSKSYEFEETQSIKLTLSGNAYVGTWSYVGQPYFIESVTVEGTDEVPSYTITSEADEGAPAAMPYTSYTSYEKLSISIASTTAIAATQKVDEHTKQYIVATITYRTDPMLQAIAGTVQSSDNAPVNMSVMVRGFIPVIISRFEVQYVKKPGVQVLLDEAEERINAYVTGLGAPDVFAEGQISKIMEEAGAKYVKGIGVAAKVQWSIADKYKSGGSTLTTEYKDGPYIFTADGLRISYRESVGTTAKYACSVRNVRYYLKAGALTFSEVKDI